MNSYRYRQAAPQSRGTPGPYYTPREKAVLKTGFFQFSDKKCILCLGLPLTICLKHNLSTDSTLAHGLRRLQRRADTKRITGHNNPPRLLHFCASALSKSSTAFITCSTGNKYGYNPGQFNFPIIIRPERLVRGRLFPARRSIVSGPGNARAQHAQTTWDPPTDRL